MEGDQVGFLGCGSLGAEPIELTDDCDEVYGTPGAKYFRTKVFGE
jgi:hypothetical protein